MASPGPTAQSVTNPQVGSTFDSGDLAGVDISNRPMFPALFITDITDPSTNPLAGDWQYDGTCSDLACSGRNGIPPHFVSGTWKGAVRLVDKTKNPPAITITPDSDPAVNNWNLGPGADQVPLGLTNQGYGAEVRWDIVRLWDKDGNPLQSGHTYRLYVMVHDGDQNNSGGDAGQMCGYIITLSAPSPTPTSTPTATFTPTATATATPTATFTPTATATSTPTATFTPTATATATATATFTPTPTATSTPTPTPTCAAITASETTTPASCFGGSNGSVTVTVSGGTAPYDVTVDGVTHSVATSGGTTTFTGLASGTYPA
ncbi:MAG: hypothetical protein DMF24_11185, partial [Verrucomicrobia bacterium]